MEIEQPSTSGSSLVVTDNIVTVTNTTEIIFSGATVTDNGGGVATVTITSGTDHFSYNIINTGVTITVPIYQQMVVAESITILGTLILIGDLALV